MRLKQKIISVASAMACAVSFCAGAMMADAVSYSQEMQYGKYFTYRNIDEDGDRQYDSVEITNCNGSANSISIPSKMNGLPVTRIGDSAFKQCSSTTVVIPDTVESIGSLAFNNCTDLESVIIGSNVETIGTWAFYKCSKLKSIIIPNSVTNIGSRAFSDCTKLASVTIELK